MTEKKCPKCGSPMVKPMKSWEMKPPENKPKAPTMKVTMMLCQNCGKKFRHAERVKTDV